jgi:hypothetical protein
MQADTLPILSSFLCSFVLYAEPFTQAASQDG